MKFDYPQGIDIAKLNEIDSIFRIEKKCFPGEAGYSKSQLKRLILNNNSLCLVEKKDGRIRAFLIVTSDLNLLIGHIETIDVDPNFQNRGIGLKLLEAAEMNMKSRGIKESQLEVSEGNNSAIELYRKAGYFIKEKIFNYYRFKHHNTRNAFRMIKVL